MNSFDSRMFSQMSVDNAVTQCLPPGFHFHTHLHHTLEMIVCLSGSVTATVLGIDIPVNQGEYFVYFPDIPHSISNPNEAVGVMLQIHFHFYPLLDQSPRQLSSKESAFNLEVSLGKRKYLKAPCNPQLEACIRGIHAEVSEGRPDSGLMTKLYLSQLNLLLSREVLDASTSGSIHQNRYVLHASLFINEHYMKKITVQEVADAAGISPRYLTKLFNESFDMGVSAYITHIRISKAIDFMYLNPKYPLTKLALDVGFSSQQHFSKVFKEKMTMSPKRYFSLQLNNY